MKRVVSTILLVILLTSMLCLAFKIMPAEAAGTIYIRADGSIDPPTAPIFRDGDTYTFTGNIYDSIVIQRGDIMVDGAGYTLQPTGSEIGIDLTGRSNVTIKSMTITDNMYGIWLEYSSSYNSISGNNITNNEVGISLYSSSSYNSISGNNITANNQYGIRLDYSSGNSISGNNITNNEVGIVLDSSLNISISGNTFTNDGLLVLGSYQNSVENNTVNGRPLVYLEGVSNYTVDDAGQVILVRCENITVEGLNLSSTSFGVELRETINSTISGNNITNSYCGIWLDTFSSYNSISGNNITNNEVGIVLVLYDSSNRNSYNTISGNNITGNVYGIMLDGSNCNSIFHNNFVNNTAPAVSINSVNVWDDGYPSGGNYWSYYTGVDANSDGIGDTPYVLDVQNVDNYPLMNPFRVIPGDINHDGTVDIFDIVIVALEFGHPPPPIVDLRADVNKDGLVDIFDIVVVALHFGETG